jgi:hypothetical protein
MITHQVNRRSFLRGMAFGVPVAIGLPIFDQMLNSNGTAFAQDGAALPRRFGVFFFGNGRGVDATRWNPGIAGADWPLSPQLEPLAAYKSSLNIISGMRVACCSGQGHHRGTIGILSGRNFIEQPAGNAPFRSTFAGPSIDQTIAAAIGAQSAFKSLELGIHSRVVTGEGTTLLHLSHNGPDNTNPPEYDPTAVFDRIFADFTAPMPTTDPGLIQAATTMSQSVLDNVNQELNALKLRVGSADRARLDQHLENIRAIEQRLTSTVQTGAACVTPARPAEGEEGAMTQRMQDMSDLTALALACDVTRVFTIMYSGSAAGPVFEEIGLSDGHHDLSHGGEETQPQIDAATIYTMEHVGLLLGALNGVAEGAGTLLGQSAILISSDTSDGAAHSVEDYPVLVAGGGGGFLKNPGVHVVDEDGNTSKVLLTLVRSMGIEAADFGGEDGYVTESATEIEA